MKKAYIHCLISGVILLGPSLSVAHAGQCKQVKLMNSSTAINKPVVYRYAHPLRVHSAYYCPDNGMYYPQTLGCMGPWVQVQR